MNRFCEWLFETKDIIYKFLVRWDGENGECNFTFVETPRKFTWCFHEVKLVEVIIVSYSFINKPISGNFSL